MFKTLALVACLAYIGSVLSSPAYTTKYDNIDLDEILNNERLFSNYFKCLMDQGVCPPSGLELRKALPDSLATNCSSCSEKQKSGTEKVERFLYKNKKEEWKALRAKYDPTGVRQYNFDD